ncbi:hypothetical protein SEMA_0043 [Pseudomonas phage vB PaM SEMA]|uniref:Uncharacterized protein n=1 Tax=Pseudomonas phage vB PaM SEMA TaxID=2982920 RepID=A0A9X9JT36_9CAUD|nr:hypothetical protein SEMA_0043 [Pseudomonas phage vB PaM SEMA]
MFKTEVKGRYTLIRRKADGTPVETLEFDNIITNAGLDWIAAMGTDLMGEPVAVSTSTADPNPSAPTIPEVVQRTSVSAPGGGTTSGLDGEWLFWRKRWRFPQGTLAGQVLATVGLICNSDRRFESNTGELIPKDTPLSYTRIKDAAGQPTTLVVAADEILDVQYEFRSRPVGTAEAKFVISGVERTFRLIPQPFANRANLSGERYIFYNTHPYINGKNASGGDVRDGQWQKKYPKYVRGSYKAQITLLAQVQNGNMAGGITGTEELQIYNGRNYVLDINPPVVKNNTQEFTVTLEFTVARA